MKRESPILVIVWKLGFDYWDFHHAFIMRIVSLRDLHAIRLALGILRKGGVVAYPTETAYGMGGDWTKPSVHRRVRQIKGRKKTKALSVIVSSVAMARKFVHFPRISAVLAKRYWPGPLSLVLPLKHTPSRKAGHPSQEGIPLPRRGTGAGTLSVRVSPHPIANALVKKLGRPLIATSANVSGAVTLYDARAIARAFAKRKYKPDLIIDAGRLKRVKPSTVVVMDGDKVKVVREGPIRVNFKAQSSNVKGMLKTQVQNALAFVIGILSFL